MNISTLLLDEEPQELVKLQQTLAEFPLFSVVKATCVPAEALSFCQENEVAAVFMEAQLGSLPGIELAARLQAVKPELLVVFVSVCGTNAVQAFTVGAQDYLLKPVTAQRLSLTVKKIKRELKLRRATGLDFTEFLNRPAASRLSLEDSIPGKDARRIYLLKMQEVLYLTAVGRNVFAAVPGNGMYKLQGTLAHWETCLPEVEFYRCHNSYIVNIDKIEYITPYFKNTYMLKLRGSEETIPVSRTFAKGLRERTRI